MEVNFSKNEIEIIDRLNYQFKKMFSIDELCKIIKKTNVVFENFIFIPTDKGDFEISYEWNNEGNLEIRFYDKNYTIPTRIISKKEFFKRLKNSKIGHCEIIVLDE